MSLFSFGSTKPSDPQLSMFESSTLESLLCVVSSTRDNLCLFSGEGKPNASEIREEKSSARQYLQQFQAACLRALQIVGEFANGPNDQTAKDVCERLTIDMVAAMSFSMSQLGQSKTPEVKELVKEALQKYQGVEKWRVAKWMDLPKNKLQYLRTLCGCEDPSMDEAFSQPSEATGTQAAGSGTVTGGPSTLPPSCEDTF